MIVYHNITGQTTFCHKYQQGARQRDESHEVLVSADWVKLTKWWGGTWAARRPARSLCFVSARVPAWIYDLVWEVTILLDQY